MLVLGTGGFITVFPMWIKAVLVDTRVKYRVSCTFIVFVGTLCVDCLEQLHTAAT